MDGGVLLLAAAERRLGSAGRLARLIADPRNPAFVTHSLADILRARRLAIACGYEDAEDLDHLRTDPGSRLACGRLPDGGRDLCSQPTVSRWESTPTLREVVRLTYALVDLHCASYRQPPEAVTLDIDDTVDVGHGHQQPSLFNAHHDERCFMPIHVSCACSRLPPASPRPPHGCASRLPPPVPRPSCSAGSLTACSAPGPDRRGIAPVSPRPPNSSTQHCRHENAPSG